ncbi:unnamed protein product [Musa hybrid cultivar]
MTTCDQLHSKIARMFFYAGLPFHLARISYFVIVFEFSHKYFTLNLMKKVTNEVGYQNIIQIIELKHNFSNIIWILYAVHTLNLALKNIYIIMNIEQNQLTYNACSWISDIASDITMIKSFTMNHSMISYIFNEFVPLKLLSIVDTRFALTTIML